MDNMQFIPRIHSSKSCDCIIICGYRTHKHILSNDGSCEPDEPSVSQQEWLGTETRADSCPGVQFCRGNGAAQVAVHAAGA